MTEQQIRRISMRGVKIPEHMIPSVLRYFNDRQPVGDFLTAILRNNFLMACSHADEQNLAALPAWAALIYNEAPGNSHGSPEKVKAWLDKQPGEQRLRYPHDAKDVPGDYVLRGDGWWYPSPQDRASA